MTTIVWKQGVLACDSQSSFDGAKYRCKEKLQERQTVAYAIAGELGYGLAIVGWAEEGVEDYPGNPDHETVVVAMSKSSGKAWCIEAPGVWIPIEDEMFACGSGGPVALGALAMGATPKEAVEAACEWDEGTGFEVQVVRATQKWKGK
jgi:hypothetical protein